MASKPRRHAERMWTVLIEDPKKGPRFLPILYGITTARTRREAEKMLKLWQQRRVRYTPPAKVVRVIVREG